MLFCIASTLTIASSRQTLYSHVIVVANSGGVLIILMNLIQMVPVNRLEIIGTLAVIAGIISLLSDKDSEKINGNTNIILGDSLSLVAMPFYTFAYVFNAKAIKKLPSMVVFHCFSLVQLILYATYCFLSNQEYSILFSRDSSNGFFGWTQPEWLPLSTLIVTPI